jgi:hypothetical protein
MEMTTPVLNYVSAINRPRVLTLELKAGAVRVTFPVLPKWVYISPSVFYSAAGLMYLAMGIGFVASMRRFSQQFHIPPTSQPFFFSRRFELEVLLQYCFYALCSWSFAGYQWWQLRRWGRVPRVLTASGEGLVLTRLGWFHMRERTWSVAEIARVELRPIKYNLNWTRTVAEMYIIRRKGRRLHYQLSSPDPLLPSKIAKQLANALAVHCCEFRPQRNAPFTGSGNKLARFFIAGGPTAAGTGAWLRCGCREAH